VTAIAALEATLLSVTVGRDLANKGSWVAIQHVPFEGPGLISDVLEGFGKTLKVCHTYLDEPLPDVAELQGLVVMGGPMGVTDIARHPHLLSELELIAAAVKAGKPVLGVCLGAQLIAAALHARVFRGEQAEIGAGSVTLTKAGAEDPVLAASGASEIAVVHWHQDTFELPPGAVWLAHSSRYPHQAFRIDPCIYALQFHIEVDRQLLGAWTEHLPAGAHIPESSRVDVERAGRVILEAFFERAGEI